MPELELERVSGERRAYSLEGVGTLRLEGLGSRTATVEAGAQSWRIVRGRFWQRRIQLAEGDRELVVLDGKGWGRRPVRVTVDELGAVGPGLLLFAAFVVRRLAADAGSASGAGATVSAGG